MRDDLLAGKHVQPIVCPDPGHTPAHYTEARQDPLTYDTEARARTQPAFRMVLDEDQAVYAELSFTGHLDLSEYGDSQITASELRQKTQQLRAGNVAAEYTSPEYHPGILLELRCVDPNRCRCLRYVGSDTLSHWPLTAPETFNESCRVNGGRFLEPLVSPDMKKQLRTRGGMCPASSHTASRTLPSRLSDENIISVTFNTCKFSTRSQCLEVTYHRRIQIKQPDSNSRVGITSTNAIRRSRHTSGPSESAIHQARRELAIEARRLDALDGVPYARYEAL
ncbi:hypothetical protein B0T22DRAFT_510139 [Podospora appendiculata]|uniref:Uncharacterized protein n=1 Tax=Podospora appendiculata TaxID=314037 RepID=A0AAE0X7U5_9PEZI|nr:hypothetical protein B0T22DRAFT_510139 [Podospora appendiculata]